ncbi:MAG: hypothetical protein ACK53Y_00865, partial [bacterium]
PVIYDRTPSPLRWREPSLRGRRLKLIRREPSRSRRETTLRRREPSLSGRVSPLQGCLCSAPRHCHGSGAQHSISRPSSPWME